MDNYLDLVKGEDTWIATTMGKGLPMLSLATKANRSHISQGSHDLSPQPSRSLDLRSTRLWCSNQAMLSYMHAQEPKKPLLKSQVNPILFWHPNTFVTQFCICETKTYHMLLCHFCGNQWYPLNPLALWSALMVVLVEMELSSSSYGQNKLARTRARTHTHTHVFVSWSTSIGS